MKKILSILNNDVFQLTKEWAQRVHATLDIYPDSPVKTKYIEGSIYFTLPVKNTEEEVLTSGLSFSTDSIMIKEDDRIYVGIRHNDILATIFEEYMEMSEEFYSEK